VAGGISYSECRTAYELAAKFPGVQVRRFRACRCSCDAVDIRHRATAQSLCGTAEHATHTARHAQVLIGSTELLTPERALQRYRCSPPTREDLEYETGTLDGNSEGGAGETSALDACLDRIPLEKIFPCCFRSEVSLPNSRRRAPAHGSCAAPTLLCL
jgi:hypothetical protein